MTTRSHSDSDELSVEGAHSSIAPKRMRTAEPSAKSTAEPAAQPESADTEPRQGHSEETLLRPITMEIVSIRDGRLNFLELRDVFHAWCPLLDRYNWYWWSLSFKRLLRTLPIPNVMKYIDGTGPIYIPDYNPNFEGSLSSIICGLCKLEGIDNIREEVLGVFDEEVPMASSFIFLTLETALKPYATEQKEVREQEREDKYSRDLEDLEDLLEDIDDDDLSDIAKNAHAEDRQASRYPEREEEEEERWLGQQEEEEAKKAGLPRVVWLPDEKGRPRFKPS